MEVVGSTSPRRWHRWYIVIQPTLGSPIHGCRRTDIAWTSINSNCTWVRFEFPSTSAQPRANNTVQLLCLRYYLHKTYTIVTWLSTFSIFEPTLAQRLLKIVVNFNVMKFNRRLSDLEPTCTLQLSILLPTSFRRLHTCLEVNLPNYFSPSYNDCISYGRDMVFI